MAKKKTIIIDVDTKQGQKNINTLKGDMSGLSTSASGAKAGIGGITTGFKALGVAWKAIGIGLIVAAFMKLKDIFSGNIETARLFERVSGRLSAAFDVIRDRTEQFIKSLIELKNPFKAFKDAFTGTTAEIREESRAMDELIQKLQEVRDREREMVTVRSQANKIIAESRLLAEDENLTMQERLVALKAAVAEEKRVADLELQIQEDKVNALQEQIDLGKSSEEDMIALEEEKAKFIDLQTASILKQKRVVTEIVTFEKQIAAEQKKNADAQLKAQQKKEEQLQKEQELRENEIEQVRVAGLTQEEIEIEQATAKYEKLIQLAEKHGLDTTTLTEQFNAQLLEIDKKYITEEELAQQREIELAEQQAAELQAIAEQEAADKLAIQKAREDASKAMIVTSGRDILSSVEQLAGEGTAAAKAAALAGILIDTARGISGAIAAGAGIPFPANLGAIFSGVATVLAGIAQAKAVFAKVPGPGDEGGDDNVSMPSPSVAASGGIGGGDLIPNMAGIEPEGGGGDTTVQAYVVENDISSSQALQQELDTQATL